MSILHDLFFSNLISELDNIPQGAAYERACQRQEEQEERLREQLSGAQWKAARDWQEASTTVRALEEEDTFLTGLRLGARMMLELLTEPKAAAPSGSAYDASRSPSGSADSRIR